MEFISGLTNPPRLEALNLKAMSECAHVKAAVAYVTDDRTLIQSCMKNDIRLTLWARYDYSMPVSEDVVKRFLNKRSPNFTLKIVPDIFHPKIIWWHEFGAYIGSANLTQRAWFGGIEAGLFLTEAELTTQGIAERLTEFFQQIDEFSHPVNDEFLAHLRDFEAGTSDLRREESAARRKLDETRQALGIGKLSSLLDITRKPAADRRRNAFLKEWNSTLQILRDIAERVIGYRPSWIDQTAPAGAQADQFLHAYYYNRVRKGGDGFAQMYRDNRHRTESALVEAFEWWKKLPEAPSGEKEYLENRLPELQDYLRKDRISTLTKEELAEVCLRIHAVYNHARQAENELLGLAAGEKAIAVERVKLFGYWLFDQVSPNGRSALETMSYVLYGGPDQDIPHRIYDCCYDFANKVPRFGVSSLGEIVGWIRPDFCPPRNNRTNKALRALGYDVAVYGE